MKKPIKIIFLLTMLVFLFTATFQAAKISKKKASVRVGSSIRLTINGLNGRKVSKWTSSNPSVAVVTKKGKVTGKSIGKAVITGRVGRKKYTCQVTVKKARSFPPTGEECGAAIAQFAQKYVGNPYKWGGTSLTKGADDSGFCYTIFNTFGFQLMRVADDQMKGPDAAMQKRGYKKGTVIKDSQLKPGDLVFYGSQINANHVAIYIGKNKVVHAANSREGIIVSDIDYVKSRVKNHNMRYWL